MKKIQKLANHFIKKISVQEESEVKVTVLESDLVAVKRILDHMMESLKNKNDFSLSERITPEENTMEDWLGKFEDE